MYDIEICIYDVVFIVAVVDPGCLGYISHDNIHEINTWKGPIQTVCG